MTLAEIEQLLESGHRAWADGEPMPAMPEGDAITPKALHWAGYIEARARDWFKRRAMAIYPETVEPRP